MRVTALALAAANLVFACALNGASLSDAGRGVLGVLAVLLLAYAIVSFVHAPGYTAGSVLTFVGGVFNFVVAFAVIMATDATMGAASLAGSGVLLAGCALLLLSPDD